MVAGLDTGLVFRVLRILKESICCVPLSDVPLCRVQPKFVMRFAMSLLLQPSSFLEHTLW